MKGRTYPKITKEKIEKSAIPSNKVKNEPKVRAKKTIETKIDTDSKQRIFHKETIHITKKKNNYLDNYQFVESKVFKNPKKNEQILTNHIRRGDTFTFQSKINQKVEEPPSKGRLSETFHTNFRVNKPDKINSRSNNLNTQQDKNYFSSTNKNKTNSKINKNSNETKAITKTVVKNNDNNLRDKNINSRQNNKNDSVTTGNKNKNEKNLKNNNSNTTNSVGQNNKNTSVKINNKNEKNLKNNNSNSANPIEQKNKNSPITMNNENKNEKNNEKDLEKKIAELTKLYRDPKVDINKIISCLTDILKADSPISDNTVKVCNFVNSINDTIIWDSVNKNILFSFLKELAIKKLVRIIDNIFMSGEGHYPLVNRLSIEYKEDFYKLFDLLPNEYQNILRFRTISYHEGDKDYACLLLGGTCLMGF